MRISDWSSDVCSSDLRFGDFLAEIVFGGLLHLQQDLGRDLLRRKLVVLDLDPGVTVVGLDDLERRMLDRFLHLGIVKAATDQPLDRDKRTEERGVGKEGGSQGKSGWGPYHEKK